EDGIRDFHVTGVQTCALPICVLVSKYIAVADDDPVALGVDSNSLSYSARRIRNCQRFQRAVVRGYQQGVGGIRAELRIARRINQIGRASCRERGQISVSDGAL